MSVLISTVAASRSVFNKLVVWMPLVLILDIMILFIPFHLLIVRFGYSLQASKEIANIVHATIRMVIVIFFIRKLALEKFMNFHPGKVINFHYLFIPFLFPLVLSIPNFSGVYINEFLSIPVMVTCLSFLLMSAAEEVLIRGLVLSALLKNAGGQYVMKPVLVSSLLFSAMHLVNLVRMNIIEVLIQMIIAFYFGVYFGALMIKTKNLFYLGLIHGIINICFNVDTVLRKTASKKYVDSWQEILVAVLTTSLILSPLFIIGYIILRKTEKQQLQKMDLAEVDIKKPG